MYLWDGFNQQKYVVEKLEMDILSKNLLNKMKIERGSVVKVIRKHSFYPSILEVGGKRIALDTKLLKKIWVIPYV